ncbi:hypothetical protein [Edaphocola aurantiacus]|uniref:hypothetical protein n=1 Tax=Edaphocola aurantiacus TaxID=2601682 RepID=UPI001C9446BA|nr:hypothetical protein [Edaphocola aurantiacus]
MKKIILLSVLPFAIVAASIISCSNEGHSNKVRISTINSILYPVVTKYQKKGRSGRYDLMSDQLTHNVISLGLLDNVTKVYITYFFDESAQQEKAELIIIGNKHKIATAHSFDLSTNDDGYFVIQD